MRLVPYEQGPHNPELYRDGWQCDGVHCGYESLATPGSAMSRCRFHCNKCNTDLCLPCGRECNPVNNRETPVVFTPPAVDTGIPSYKETMTGSGATYNLKVTDTAGNSWVVAKKYTDFAMLHKALKGATWSDARPSPQPFPKKESFPSVPARAKLFASYLHWITTHIDELELPVQTLVVRFLKGNFTVDGWPSVEEGGQRRASPNAVLIGRGKFLYDEGRVHCASCNGEALNVQRYSPGMHNPEGYRRGWSCDVCTFLSTSNPGTEQAQYRFHCSRCQADLCGDGLGSVPCCVKEIQTGRPQMSAVRTSVSGDGGGAAAATSGGGGDAAAAANPPSFPATSLLATPTRASMGVAAGAETPPSLRKMRHAKQLLDEGLISQGDYDSAKSAVLSGLVEESLPRPL